MVMMAVLRVTMIRDRAVTMLYTAIGQVRMIVVMFVDRQCRRCAGTKQRLVFGT